MVKYEVWLDGKLNVLNRVYYKEIEEAVNMNKASESASIHTKRFRLSYLGKREFGGLEEIELQSDTHLTRLTCTSTNGILYQIPKGVLTGIKNEDAMR